MNVGKMTLSKEELYRYVGDLSQIAGIEDVEYSSGLKRGMRAYIIKNASGLEFEVIPDMCLNISSLRYKGVNISWLSKTGYVGTKYIQPMIGGFARYFSGGMLWTCGLKNTGDDYLDKEGVYNYGHGRIGILPAENVWAKSEVTDDNCYLTVGGEMRDSELGGQNLHLLREIKTSIDKPIIEITDRLINLEPTATDYLILYHFNFGFPFISPAIKFNCIGGVKEITPRTQKASNNIERWDCFTVPIDEEEEECFFIEHIEDRNGIARFEAINSMLGIGAFVEYKAENLPVLTFWKCVRSGEYVCGIEPGNSHLEGLHKSRECGDIGHIEGFEEKEFKIRLGFFDASEN